MICKPYFSACSWLLQLWILLSSALPYSWEANTALSFRKGIVSMMRIHWISEPLSSRSLKNTERDPDEDPEEERAPDPALQEFKVLELVLSQVLWFFFCLDLCLYKMAANDVSQYAISSKGEVQSIGVADMRERGVQFGLMRRSLSKGRILGFKCTLVQGLARFHPGKRSLRGNRPCMSAGEP